MVYCDFSNSLYKQRYDYRRCRLFYSVNDVEKYALDSKKDSVLVKGLSLSELESLRG